MEINRPICLSPAKNINIIGHLQAMVLSPIPRISIEKRASTGWMEKDPENKPRKENVSPETNP
jgi:hypothetical protein